MDLKKNRVQGNAFIRISTFYRPVPKSQGVGPGYVYSHHLTLFNTKNRGICPRQGFMQDIKEEIEKWKADRDHTLLMGDFNEYIPTQISRQFFSKLGLRDLITENHV